MGYVLLAGLSCLASVGEGAPNSMETLCARVEGGMLRRGPILSEKKGMVEGFVGGGDQEGAVSRMQSEF